MSALEEHFAGIDAVEDIKKAALDVCLHLTCFSSNFQLCGCHLVLCCMCSIQAWGCNVPCTFFNFWCGIYCFFAYLTSFLTFFLTYLFPYLYISHYVQ